MNRNDEDFGISDSIFPKDYGVEETTIVFSTAVFDKNWNFVGRRVQKMRHSELTDHSGDMKWWHALGVSAAEELKADLRFDELHISSYIGDMDPSPEYIKFLIEKHAEKGHGDTVQYHNGKERPSFYL